MKLLANIGKALGLTQTLDEKAVSLTDLEAFGLLGAVPTASGISVNAAQAMRVPAVACAMALISETVGTLPVKLRNAETKQTDRTHPAFRLIHDEANPWTSAGQLRTQLTLDALTRDTGGFALVTRYSDGRPAELHRLDPSRVTIVTEQDGAPAYIVETAAGKTKYPFTEVLHLAPFGGIAPLTMAREAIGLAVAFEQHIGALFKNGGRPSGLITSPKILDVEAKKKIAGSWFNTHAGAKAGGTAILDEGMAYQALSTTLADAQFAENRVEQIREIARAFRIPAPMIGELGRATWSNLEQLNRQFLQMTLAPWLRAWEAAYSRVLLAPDERTDLRIEFLVDALLETDTAARATAYGQYRSMGVMTANEVRAGLNLPANAEGDTLANPYTTSGAA
ncbi:phage portal protein [Mameliella sp. AT18]|uniref:phage portal protein n=1 Tax=Mameliella sp. AT18 TaxID=3028385 RepID=UPI00237BA7E9|nr:phage portal protein [Mameliella sp. AT18]MDD9730458.1 phage portal protein [Mameliella sp. AT18]